MESKSVLVLGMHRSGTSLLTGSLEQAGLYLGSVTEKGLYNLKGSRENVEIRKFNERILADRNYSWRNPPKESIPWTPVEIETGKLLIKKYFSTQPLWGMKDPRLVWTLRGWIKTMKSVRLIGVFRHPSFVAASLEARKGNVSVPLEEGYRLWYLYNTKLVRLYNEFSFPLLHFSEENQLQKSFFKPLESFCESLGLRQPVNQFFEANLINQKTASVNIPEKCQNLYEKMVQLHHQDL